MWKNLTDSILLQRMTDKIPQNRMVNYLIASDLMIELEEAEHARHLEMFDQKNVRLTYTGDNQRFSFPFTVSYNGILLIWQKLS